MELYPRQYAERENEGLGEDPPASPMTHQQVVRTRHQTDQLHSSDGALPTTVRRAKRENGGLRIPQEVR
jgi:hypothetical protein